MKKKLPSGGWQANVEYFEDYIIKTPKTIEETRREVHSYLSRRDNLGELDRVVEKIRNDWNVGLGIAKGGRIPNKMFGYLEFLIDGRIKQRRVGVLEEVWGDLYNSGKEDEMRRIVDKTLDFIVELWKYGVHEKSLKFGSELGLMGDDIVLIDFGELCEERSVAEFQLPRKPWVGKLEKYSCAAVAEYFNSCAEEKLTLEVLKKNWGKYI